MGRLAVGALPLAPSGTTAAHPQVRERLPDPLGGAETPTRHLVVPPGEGLDERLDLVPGRRGGGTVGRSPSVLGPLGLAWRQGTVSLPWSATVYPSVPDTPLRALPLQVASPARGGPPRDSPARRRPAVRGLREWVPGDETRIIDWKATARRGKPIARQYEDERRQQVLIVIDAGRLLTAEVHGVPRLEAVISAALQLARAAVEHDDNVG